MRRIFLYISPAFLAGCANFQEVLREVKEVGEAVVAVAPGVIAEVKPAVEAIAANPSDPTAIIIGVGAAVAAVTGGIGEVLRRQIKKNGKAPMGGGDA